MMKQALTVLAGGLVGFVGLTRPVAAELPPPPPLESYVIPAGCWTVTDEPLAPLPASAFIEWRDGRQERTYRARLVDLAFRDALGLVDPKRFDTIALCRR